MNFPNFDKAIRLKRQERTTPLGCKVSTVWYTSMQGEVTEEITLQCPRPILPAPRARR